MPKVTVVVKVKVCVCGFMSLWLRQRILYSARGAVYRINSLIYIQVFDDENSIKQAVQVNTKDLKRAYIGEARSVKASAKAGEPLRSQKRKTREKPVWQLQKHCWEM